MNNELKVGDLLKYYDGDNKTSICLVTRVSNTHFDVRWLIARGFADNEDTSRGYTVRDCFQNTVRKHGWSKLS